MKTKYLTALLIPLFFTSCEKELDFEYHEIEPLTVIEGLLTPEGVKVGLTLTTPMGEPMDRTHLTDAEVSLTDLTLGLSYSLTPDEEGYFCNSVEGVAGHEYRLSVAREGATHTAETVMFAPVRIESADFSWIRMPYDHVSTLKVIYNDDREIRGECFWIKIYRNGEIYKWAVQDDRTSANGEMSFVSMMSRQDLSEEEDDEALREGDVVTVEVERISRTMNDYLDAIGNDSSGPAMFTGPKVLGYFLATSPVSVSIDYHPDEIPYYH